LCSPLDELVFFFKNTFIKMRSIFKQLCEKRNLKENELFMLLKAAKNVHRHLKNYFLMKIEIESHFCLHVVYLT